MRIIRQRGKNYLGKRNRGWRVVFGTKKTGRYFYPMGSTRKSAIKKYKRSFFF